MKRLALATLVVAFATTAFAAPAGATVTFEGTCDIDGVSWFGKPLRPVAQDMDWGFYSNPGGGTCTGLLNGNLVVDEPVDVTVDAHGPISCGVAGYSIRADFQAVFPSITTGDQTLSGKLTLAAVAAQNALVVEGNEGGQATGRASFFGQNDQVAVLQGCLDGNTIRELKVNVTVVTVLPLKG
ncbi:MAG TPA: hypothetical protein VF715_19040 [Thermoleophilaceae bacterium]|jgi:hypothetical protein